VKSNNALIDRIAQRINKTFSSFSSVSRLRDPHGEINHARRQVLYLSRSVSCFLDVSFLQARSDNDFGVAKR